MGTTSSSEVGAGDGVNSKSYDRNAADDDTSQVPDGDNDNDNHTASTSTSTTNGGDDVVCEKCDARKYQKKVPKDDIKSSKGGTCEQYYKNVTICMKQNKGQISKCTKEWDLFRDCHNNK